MVARNLDSAAAKAFRSALHLPRAGVQRQVVAQAVVDTPGQAESGSAQIVRSSGPGSTSRRSRPATTFFIVL